MKKALVLIAAILVALIGYVLEPQDATPLQPSQLADVAAVMTDATTTPALPQNIYPVVKVVDGDTLDVLKEGKTIRLRLIGLDTPETVDPRKPVQCFGQAASDKAREMLAGKIVRLEYDASQGMLDKYGRTLAYVFMKDGANFNEYMIAEGYGHEYTYNLPYKYQREFKAAEKSAREQKKGLWADDACAGKTSKTTTAL
ncbi:thermonuclease family protein [Candidatus Kaiserbacteria bacterium]|nr:thermonuclease family protein [Candidatus Kaiserbacteria bacterium]